MANFASSCLNEFVTKHYKMSSLLTQVFTVRNSINMSKLLNNLIKP